MKDFHPRKLHESLVAVRQAHPDLGSALDGSENPQGTEALRALRAKVLSADNSYSLAQSLTKIERRIINWLVLDDSARVRAIAREVAAIAPNLFPTYRLWDALQNEQGDRAFTELIALLSPRTSLRPLQRLLIQDDEYCAFFEALVDTSTSLDTAFEEAKVYTGRLHESVLAAGAEMGSLKVWALYETSEIVGQLERLAHPALHPTCENFHANNHQVSSYRLVQIEPVQALLNHISRTTVLEDLAPEVRSWFERLLVLVELREFFSKDDNSERWDFWARYADQARDIFVQRAQQRLFIEFDSVGVIEFEEVGNAGYIYNIDDFRRLMFLARLTSMRNTDLKKRDRASRIIHSKNWQANTAWELRSYGVYRGTV